MHWGKIAIAGVGLLGGSIGMAVKKRRLADSVHGFVRRTASIEECRKAGAVDEASRDLESVVADAELIILCTPLGQMRELAQKIAPAIKPGVLITDVGSVKASVIKDVGTIFSDAGACFVGSHPMAGAEKMGVKAARADLFEDAICAVTPGKNVTSKSVKAIEEFWESLGARTLRLSPETHDDLVSRSSHLPHVVAAELANYVLSPAHLKEQSLLCATGFRDTTRIAAGSPEMWRDIAMANRVNLKRVLGVFIEDLQEFCEALKNEDAETIEEFFQKAKQRRDKWSPPPPSASLE